MDKSAKRTPSAKYQARVGHAYRGRDGIVRWIRGLSTRNFYTMFWLNEETGVWNYGSTIHAKKWDASPCAGDEVAAPQPGDTYKYAGVFGDVREITR